MTFGAHKLVHSEPFLDYLYEFWHLLSALCSDVQKFFYIGAHLQSRPQTTTVEFFSNPSDIYTKWCAQTFPPIFELFTILTAISRKLWRRPATEKWTMPSFWKGNDFLKKTLTTTSKSTHKPWHNSCSNYVPLSRRALRPWSVTDKKTNKNSGKHRLPRWLSGMRHSAHRPAVCRRGGVQSLGRPVDFVFGFQGRMLWD